MSDADLWLRLPRPDDVARISQIERASFSDPWSPRSFGELLAHDGVFFRVLADAASDEPVGYVVAWFVVDEAEIANVAIAPERRGQGLGRRLLDETLNAARLAGVTDAFLEVRTSNTAARRLYASRGFVEVGRRRGYYTRPPEDALVMRAELG